MDRNLNTVLIHRVDCRKRSGFALPYVLSSKQKIRATETVSIVTKIHYLINATAYTLFMNPTLIHISRISERTAKAEGGSGSESGRQK